MTIVRKADNYAVWYLQHRAAEGIIKAVNQAKACDLDALDILACLGRWVS